MSDWRAGYVTDVEYTYGYYPELNPLRAHCALIRAGFRTQEIRTACELGFGQGLPINFHAAASRVEWWGTDFSPSQAKFAQDCGSAAQSDVRLYNESFSEFCARRDIPDFDYIALHGIWSWISPANWAVIVEFIRRKLRVGGVLYISYNAMPGWSVFAPIQHLLLEHAKVLAARGRGVVARFEASLDFVDRLLQTNPRYALANPAITERLKKLREQNPAYATHEYLCEEWHPLAVADMARWLEPAKMSYACSAHYLDHVDALNLMPGHQSLLAEIPDPLLRETVRDFMVNQQFRRDYWVKGARRLTALEQLEALRRQRVILAQPAASVSLTAKGAAAQATLSDTVYRPMLDALAGQEPKTIAQLERSTAASKVSFAQLIEAVMVLTGTGATYPAQDPELSRASKAAADRLNRYLMGFARAGAEIDHLASPVTAGGIPVNRVEQVFLLARMEGREQPREWAQFAWQLFAGQGQRMLSDGKPLASAEENIAYLEERARAFTEERLPILKALQIA